jgi:diguanylate cyclase (GGDEF)-like protein
MSLGGVTSASQPASLQTRRFHLTLLVLAACAAGVAILLDSVDGHGPDLTSPAPRLAASTFALLGGLAASHAAWDRSRRDAARRRSMVWLATAAAMLWIGQAVGFVVTAWEPGPVDMRVAAIPLLVALPVATYPLLSICWPSSMTAADVRIALADGSVSVLSLGLVWWLVVVPGWVYESGREGWERLDQAVMFGGLAMVALLAVVSRKIGSLPFVQLALLLGGMGLHLGADTFGQVMREAQGLGAVTLSLLGYLAAVSLVIAFCHRPSVEPEGVRAQRAREWLSAGLPAALALVAGCIVIEGAFSAGALPGAASIVTAAVLALLLLTIMVTRVSAAFELRRAREGAVETLLAERTREGWFRALVGDSAEYVFVLDARGVLVYASPRVERDIALHDAPQRFDPSHRHTFDEVLVDVPAEEVRLLLALVSIDQSHVGPYDLQLKGRDPAVLDVSLVIRPITDVEFEGYVVTARDVSDARRLQRQIDSSQRQDSLTSLLSRDALLVALRRHLELPDPYDSVAVVVLDLERFTALNDTLGHETGDEILVAVARTFEHLPASVRAAARISADAFAWIVVASDIEMAVAECIELCRGELRGLILQGGRETEVVFRAGYAVVEENPGRTADWYLEAADLALARSRSSRHALLVGYHEDMRAETERRVAAERLLRWAIAEHRLEMYYQPVVRLKDGITFGAEALMRLRGPDGAMVPPSEFIPIAEEVGLSGELGLFALRTACRQTARVSALVGRPLYVSVNVSADQLTPDLVLEVAECLTYCDLDPHRLTLEITESILADRSPQTQKVLRDLREKGVTISLDDFGTGYSSISYLATLPVDGLKIDRSFVSVMGAAGQGQTLARLVVQLAGSLQLGTVAEGIETLEQADLLRGMGCDYGQGYLYARPMPFDDYVEWLRGPLSSVAAEATNGQ